MSFHCSVLTTTAELEALRPAWDELLARSATDGPMLSPSWSLAWWRVFGTLDGRRLSVAVLRDGERLVGLAPLLARTHRYAPGIPFRRLELLGTGEPEADEVGSEYLGIIAGRGSEPAVARAFAEALEAGALGPWDEVVLGPMDRDNPVAAALAAELARVGAGAELAPTGPAYYIELPRTFTEYLARLSSSSRYLVTRSLREFEKWAGRDAQLHVAATPSELEEGKRALVALHGERWGGRGAFASTRFRSFHDEVMAALLARGELELAWLTVRGEPFAAAYDILWQGKVYYYQSGRRVDVPRNIRPGIVLLASLVQRAIDCGRREYDFFGGAYRYKRELATACRTGVCLRAVRRQEGLRERTRLLADDGRAAARAVRRALAPARPAPPVRHRTGEADPVAVLHGDVDLLRCFAGTGVPTVALTCDPDAPLFFSRYCGQRRLIADAGADPAAALADLTALGKLYAGRPVLCCGDDAMLLLVSRHRAELSDRFRFLLPSAALVEALFDKPRFSLLARGRGLPVAADRPADGERHVFSFHAYLDAQRRPLGHYTGRKIRTCSRHGGASTHLELVDAPELTRAGFEVIARLDLAGVVVLDFERDARTGRFHLIEVSLRFSPSEHLGAVSGVNLPLLAYQDLAGLPAGPAKVARPSAGPRRLVAALRRLA